jgi:hypothetical protein
MRTFSRARWRSRRQLWPNRVLTLLPVSFLLAASVWADESADRVAIDRTIAALNEVPLHAALFTGDGDAAAVLEQLRKGITPMYRPRSSPSVTISHEPWREATIHLPAPANEVINPRIASGSVRFITPDVALVDGSFTNRDGSGTQTKALLFVLRKQADGWKIASLRVLAPR